MAKLPYQQVLEGIRAEYFEGPGMRLTLEQVIRVAGVDRSICQAVLGDLLRAGFLSTAQDGSYTRVSDASIGRAPDKSIAGSQQAGSRYPAG